jgi:lipid-A-disaccharide synthase
MGMDSANKPLRVFITVADVSGDHHAAELAKSLRELDPSIIIEGHGGSAMRAAGVQIYHDTVAKAVMLVRAVVRGFEFWRLIRWTRRHYLQNRPDLHICIDSSGINLHFAKMARSVGVPVLYYIAPQLWASREYRIKKVQRFVNRVACILPFEEPYYRGFGVDATFVGHPLFDELPKNRMAAPQPVEFTPQRPPVIGLMPGSRRAEVRANFPHMLNVLKRIREKYPGVVVEIPTTPPTHDLVQQLAAGHGPIRIEQNALDAMAPRWDFCLAKSGTTTLHLAAYGVPMIVVYRVTKLAWHAVGRWFVKIPSFALVNILAERAATQQGKPPRRIVPEFMPWNGSDEPVAKLAIEMLQNVTRRLDQRNNLLKVAASLDQPGASLRTAQIAIDMMQQSRAAGVVGPVAKQFDSEGV